MSPDEISKAVTGLNAAVAEHQEELKKHHWFRDYSKEKAVMDAWSEFCKLVKRTNSRQRE